MFDRIAAASRGSVNDRIASRVGRLCRSLASAALAVAMAAASLPAAAQGANVAGTWGCTYGVRDTGPMHRPAIYMEFQMQVLPNGGAQGQGVMASVAGQYPVSFQGGWQLTGSAFNLQAQMMNVYGQTPFVFGSTVLNDYQMSQTVHAPDGNVIVMSCRRIG